MLRWATVDTAAFPRLGRRRPATLYPGADNLPGFRAREDSITGDLDRVGSRAMNTLEWRRWERVSKTNQ